MHTYDLSPLFRTTVGFDRMARILEASVPTKQTQYPPYNIVRVDDTRYRITLAVAGFSESDIDIQTVQGRLIVKGRLEGDESVAEYLHRGIAGRGFEHTFQLADYLKVVSARLDKGLLHIDLEREVPEAHKPRSIKIQS